ncbi:MAG: hypothetical protein HYT48_00850 [Candidatus Vogelbacteria bacterium]|nr:hypothetical protein [Candidatus Vogelbacteria bacterium]
MSKNIIVTILLAIIVILGVYLLVKNEAQAPIIGGVDLSGWQDVKTVIGPGQEYEIRMRELAIPAGQTFEAVLINDAIYDPLGEHPQSFAEFAPRRIGRHDFYFINLGLFEAQMSLIYYLPLPEQNKVYAFDLISRGILNWMEPTFDPEQNPGHLKLKELLSNL